MLFASLVTSTLETTLNQLLYRDRALCTARQRLRGRVLKIELVELPSVLVILFHDQQLDVVTNWEGDVDCTVQTQLSVLPILKQPQQITGLIRNNRLNVSGDLQVLQQFIGLLQLVEWDLAQWLSPYTGDIIAQEISQVATNSLAFIRRRFLHDQQRVHSVMTEEWQLLPTRAEINDFAQQVGSLAARTTVLLTRANKIMEDLHDTE